MSTKKSKIKLVLIGDSRVGKTSLRKRYMGESFLGTYTATLGADFSVKTIHDTVVTIYDLAGDPGSSLFRSQYYLGTQGIIMVFDITNQESFDNLPKWFDEFKTNLHPDLKIFVLGNKDDLRSTVSHPVDDLEVYEYTQSLEGKVGSSISYLNTSALTGFNVDVAFNKLITEILYN